MTSFDYTDVADLCNSDVGAQFGKTMSLLRADEGHHLTSQAYVTFGDAAYMNDSHHHHHSVVSVHGGNNFYEQNSPPSTCDSPPVMDFQVSAPPCSKPTNTNYYSVPMTSAMDGYASSGGSASPSSGGSFSDSAPVLIDCYPPTAEMYRCLPISTPFHSDVPKTFVGASSASMISSAAKPKRRRIITKKQRVAANVRERRRMLQLNDAFEDLRKRLPTFTYERTLSRIETLKLALKYIHFMSDLVNNVSDSS